MMDMSRWKHKKMAAAVDSLYMQLKYMAKCEGNEEAKSRLQRADKVHQKFARDAYDNKLSYGHYLGAYERLSLDVARSKPRPKRRSLISA